MGNLIKHSDRDLCRCSDCLQKKFFSPYDSDYKRAQAFRDKRNQQVAKPLADVLNSFADGAK